MGSSTTSIVEDADSANIKPLVQNTVVVIII
jgi:hypothetical protein